MQYIYITKSANETHTLGYAIGKVLESGDVLSFWGGLGVGKTCIIQGIARGLDVPENVYITSPTFVILNQYKGKVPVYHFDFYRINTVCEAIDLGCEEYFFSRGVTLIEWSENIISLLPEEYIKINIVWISDLERRFEIKGIGSKKYKDKVAFLNKQINK
ncbi:MAG: tRNA (adenosine(37)-N6)-threonylcarbamoyltransferase complex ATPase subunit type 1 TsaE [bacterium]